VESFFFGGEDAVQLGLVGGFGYSADVGAGDVVEVWQDVAALD
jgi:hypothetical protein